MFATQEAAEVKLLCNNELMKAVIDVFGTGVRTKPVGEDRFQASVKVCVSPTFFRWVFGWDGLMKIESPSNVKARYKEMLAKELERY